MDRAGALRAALAARGGPRLPAVEWAGSLVSTNDRLKALARGGAPEWTAVLADAQTGGRGREGRTWVSPPGGLYLSVLLRPRFAKVGLLPLAAGVAVAEAAAELGVATELKWPNDVLASGRKLAGILAEAVSGPSGVEWVVLGLGVNVALEASTVPPEIAGAVTSLAAEGAGPRPIPEVAAAVLARLGVCYDALRSSPGAIVSAWRSRSAPWWGGLVDVRTADGPLQGRLRDVDEEGALVIELEGGERRRFLSGEVDRVRPARCG
jgi:BirA family biotin operon repressor/biotin-[acetyl-CoA-carboxylase] ligase